MLRCGQPVLDDLFELNRRHTGMSGGYDFQQRLISAGQRAFEIAFDKRGERLCVLPLRMLRREGLDAVERKEKLEVHRLLGPERAVVIKRTEAIFWWHIVRASFPRHFFDKFH